MHYVIKLKIHTKMFRSSPEMLRFKWRKRDEKLLFGVSNVFRREMEKKQELGVEVGGNPRVQTRETIYLVYVDRATLKCVVNRQIKCPGGDRAPVKLECVVEISGIGWGVLDHFLYYFSR
uniref:Putative ovule protein n=1 Tax=Solanum chacoense TaxID=4108 RepID=A0A0V0I5A8_SOLCH